MKNVLLVFGGRSYEHDISVVTASQIFNKTKLDDVNLVPLYVSRTNHFFVYGNDRLVLKDFAKKSDITKNKRFKEVVFVSGENNKLFVKSLFGLKEYMMAELAIFACHGSLGENGKLVAFLEQFGIFSSAGKFDSLAICMNKFLFKQTMKGLSIPVVKGFKITSKELDCNKKKLEFLLRLMKFPVVIKPNNGGSSIGMFVAETMEDFYEKIKSAFEFDDEVLIEKYVSNTREFNIAVMGNFDSFVVSEIDEPLKEHEILSFSDKYLAGGKKSGKLGGGLKNSMASQLRRLPADIPEELRNKIQALAKKIFVSLGLTGIVRIDFLFDEQNGKLYVCEVNSIPGSLAFYFFKENTILVNKLVENLIDDAMFNKIKASMFKDEFSTTVLE